MYKEYAECIINIIHTNNVNTNAGFSLLRIIFKTRFLCFTIILKLNISNIKQLLQHVHHWIYIHI